MVDRRKYEKKLGKHFLHIFDHTKKTEELNVHTISDLEAFYDRQILESCELVK